MTYLKSLFPRTIPAKMSSDDDLRIWQERFLQTYLIISAVFGLIICGLSYGQVVQSQNWTFFTGGALLFSFSLFMILLRKVSYWIRSIMALVVLFAFSNFIFFLNGWAESSLILITGFSFLASILLYQNSVKIGIGITLATLSFWLILHVTTANNSNTVSFTTQKIFFDFIIVIMVGAILNFAIFSFKRKLIEKQNVLKENRKELGLLENQLQHQTDSLEKRIIQINTASEISQKLSSIIDPQTLVQQVADLLKDRFDMYYVGVFLVDKTKEYAVLAYGTGDPGKRMLAAKHRLAVGGYSMIGWATQTRKARVALDVGKDAAHFDNPFLPETRSELALPIIGGTNLLGALTIQSKQENAFDNNDVLILQSVADNLGVALENANSFKKSQSAFEEIRKLNRSYVQTSWWNTLRRADDISANYEDEIAALSDTHSETVQVPLKIRNEVIGNFNFEVENAALNQDQIDFLDSISTQTSIALENAQLLSETQRSALQEQKINELSAQFSRSMTIEEIIKTAVSEFGKLPSVSQASISLIPPEESTGRMLPDREVK